MRSRSIRSRGEGFRRGSRWLLALSLAAALTSGVAAPSPSAAQSAGEREREDVRRARQHYKRGEEAFNDGRFEEAYREFEAGYAVVPRPAFLLNMAHAERKRGELRSARALYKKYLLIEPDTNLRGEVEKVIREIDSAITSEEAAAARATAPLVPPPAAPVSSVVPPPAIGPGLFPGGSSGANEPAGGLGSGAAPGEAADDRRGPGGRWWIWATVGGVVVAGVATALLLSRTQYQESGSLGTFAPP